MARKRSGSILTIPEPARGKQLVSTRSVDLVHFVLVNCRLAVLLVQHQKEEDEDFA